MKETEPLPRRLHAPRFDIRRWALKGTLLAASCAAGPALPASSDATPRSHAPLSNGPGPTAPPRAPSETPTADAACAWPVAGSVEALLQAETEVALRARRADRLGVGSPSERRPGLGPGLVAGAGAGARTGQADHDRVAVAAIYGVGRRLHVDVRINGQLTRYRKGQRWPEHAPSGGAGVYALAAVLGECVRLQSGTHAQVTCLDAPRSAEGNRN